MTDEGRSRRCERKHEDTALYITDLLFGKEVIVAEWVPPFSIQVAIRLTPSMKNIDDKSLREIYEFLLSLATKEALHLIFEPEKKMCAIGVKFPCVQSYTEMESSLGNCADELYSFIGRYNVQIEAYLQSRGVR